jgi:hypothetical protein
VPKVDALDVAEKVPAEHAVHVLSPVVVAAAL